MNAPGAGSILQVCEPTIMDRLAALDWSRIAAELDANGCATLPGLLSAQECAAHAALFAQHDPFRSRVVMARHGFGRGEYKYFAYPLPETVATHGFAILNRLRRHWPKAQSFLMDRDTLLRHRDVWSEEPRERKCVQDLEALDSEERLLYDDLRNDRLGVGVRLEQERIEFGQVQAAICAIWARASG